jgi:hypothetical protein
MIEETKPIAREVLLGDAQKFTPSQLAARKSYIEQFPYPTSEWLREEDPVNRLATGIYNVIVESGSGDPRFAHDDTWGMAGEFADVLETGGDALLWTLIRIGLDECENGDVVGLADCRGYEMRETPRVAAWLKWANSPIHETSTARP